MNAARRVRQRAGWPRGLYMPREGYYVWRHPLTHKTLPIGRVPLAVAIDEAIAANLHLADAKPSLVERIAGGADKTVADVIAKMPAPAAASSKRSYAFWDGVISAKIGAVPVRALTVADCASVIEDYRDAGKDHTARSLRARLKMICRRAIGLGWADMNPAEVTDTVQPVVQRKRLTLANFQAILAAAQGLQEWLPRALLLGIVTGQDRSTVAAMRRSHIVDGHLVVWRKKTRRSNAPVEIPLTLRMDVLGVSLADLVRPISARVDSEHLLHHVRPRGDAALGDPVSPGLIGEAFARARELAGVHVGDPNPATFHELRSLSKRLYVRQGGVDTKALLGHKSDGTAALYADPRGVEPVRVSVTPSEQIVNNK